MNIIVIGQEEPAYFGPFLRSIIAARHNEIKAVVIAGDRGAGNHPKSFRQKLEDIYKLWLIMESSGFIKNLCLKVWQVFLAGAGLIGSALDKRSIRGVALKHKIPLLFTKNVNDETFLEKLKLLEPDLIVNQSELLLKEGILKIPKIGVLNRHASLLPHFRGRLGSWWSHAHEPPEYGVTIHFVDKDIDSGPIIVQKQYKVDFCLSYSQVLDILFKRSEELMLEALDKLAARNFSPLPNNYQGTKTCLFPTLKEVRKYRQILKKRRAR